MTLPEDLTPTERRQLSALLDADGMPDDDYFTEPPPEVSSTWREHIADPREDPDAAPALYHNPAEMLDLNTGQGHWRGRNFTINPVALKSVQVLAVDAIAEQLMAEIGQLRTEAASEST